MQRLLGGLGSFPPYFLRLREVNRAGPHLYGTDTPTLERLDPGDVERRLAAGGQLIDVRPIHEYAAGHVPGSLSIELRGQFATWLGWLVEDPTAPLLFVIADGQNRDDLVHQCLKIGYENLAGELAGGVVAWQATGRDIAVTHLADTPQSDRTVVDVRQRSEWDAGHIPDAVHVELGDLTSAVDKLPNDRLITHCVHGQRSTTAASLLEQAGRGDVAVFTGGPDEWKRDQSARN